MSALVYWEEKNCHQDMLTTTGDVPNMPLRLGGPGGHALQARHLPALLQRHRLQRLPRLPLVQVADLIPLGSNGIKLSCRKRLGPWCRKASKDGTLVHGLLWEAIQRRWCLKT